MPSEHAAWKRIFYVIEILLMKPAQKNPNAPFYKWQATHKPIQPPRRQDATCPEYDADYSQELKSRNQTIYLKLSKEPPQIQSTTITFYHRQTRGT